MAEVKKLYEIINERKVGIKEFNPEVFQIPNYIVDNLKYDFFDWQIEALENFLYYENPKSRLQKQPTHLMFNMATGSGKTLVMASLILYYYKRGYRHFIFFVNANNIVDKTQNNFVDNFHNKYLFKDKIVIDDKTVEIKEVGTFSDEPQGIEVKFTTIQKLYNDIHVIKENQTTLDDLHSKNIVMLADEAHHLNANTKANKGQQKLDLETELKDNASVADVEKKGWEHTVIELILHKNGIKDENKNVLLEFTATVPDDKWVAEKYEDKIISSFPLKDFLNAGYTKEINLIASTLEKKERILQALLFGWYRHKIAIKYNIPNFKPVVLFRSKTIEESKNDYDEFLHLIENISSNDFDFLKTIEHKIAQSRSTNEQGKSRTEQVLKFIKTNNINLGEICEWVKQSYRQQNVIITNSKDGTKTKEKTTDEQEKLLNSLEDKNNHIRAIFTVARLTEGWDVLNLFDIVRLYEGRDEGKDKTGNRKAGSSTVAEKQLIGRGVRYYPFDYNDKIKNKRKFDDDVQNELRVLEELYFYSTSDHRYIDEFKRELKKEGYIKDDRVVKTFSLKKEFEESSFYKNTKVWYNKQVENPFRKRKTLNDIREDFIVPYRISELQISEQELDFNRDEDLERLNLQEKGLQTFEKRFKDIEKHIFRKAINIKAKQGNSLYQFEKLKNELSIESIDDLQKDDVLGAFKVNIVANKNMSYDDISNSDKLNIAMKFLEKIFAELNDSIAPYKGSEFVAGDFKQFFSESKTKIINETNLDDSVSKDNEWYVLDGFVGTSEEKALIEFIKNTMGNLESKHDEIYLLRNEEVYKVYDFDQGRGFQPDFILFLKGKDSLQYQIFIEPKGNEFVGDDGTFKTGKEGWKEKFLEEISEKYGFDNVIKAENPNYRLVGLPFFNESHNGNFTSCFDKLKK